MVIANHSKNREPALSIVVLKLPTVKGKEKRLSCEGNTFPKAPQLFTLKSLYH